MVLSFALAPLGPEDKGLKSIKAGDVKRHMVWLADDARNGREAGSEGGHEAALYIAEHYRRCGLEPGGQEGSYFQGFDEQGVPGSLQRGEVMEANRIVVTLNRAGTKSLTLKIEEDFWPLAGSPDDAVEGEIVFAGYGITAPEHKWNDYRSAKVKGAIVMVLDHEPREDEETDVFDGKKATKYSDWKLKVETAARKKAGALLIVLDPKNHPEQEFPESLPKAWPPETDPTLKIPAMYISRSAARRLAKLAGKDLSKLQKTMDEKFKPKTFRIKGKPARAVVSRKGAVNPGLKNVVAIWPGTDKKLKDEYIVVGAHYDHVGTGAFGSRGGQGEVHNGSDDNASGTAALLELAEALQHVKFKRTVMLISFDGEEKGLWGSKAYVDDPTIPIKQCRWMINMDMVSRNDLTDIAVGRTDPTNEPLNKALARSEKKFKFKFDRTSADPYVRRSDQWNFFEKGVPAIFLFGKMHPDYHTSRDDVEKANFKKVQLTSRVAFLILYQLANKEK